MPVLRVGTYVLLTRLPLSLVPRIRSALAKAIPIYKQHPNYPNKYSEYSDENLDYLDRIQGVSAERK